MMNRLKYRIVRAVLIIVIVGLIIFEMTMLAPRRMSVHFETVQSSKIPSSFDNLSLAVFSDVYGNGRNLESAISAIQAYQPEVIVFNGNLFNTTISDNLEQMTTLLSSLQAPLGKFAILSNQDLDSVRIVFQNAGFTLLNNQQTNLYTVQKEAISLVGLSQDISVSNTETFTLGFANNPALVDTLNDAHLDLMVSGKTNLGQVTLPFIGSLFYRNQHTKRHQIVNNTALMLSSGVSTPTPEVRLLTRPEVLILRLKSNH